MTVPAARAGQGRIRPSRCTTLLSMFRSWLGSVSQIRARWSWTRATGVGTAGAALIAVPTDLIDTPWFTRMTPTWWWDYVSAVAAVVLVVVLAGLGVRRGPSRCRTAQDNPVRVGSAPWAGVAGVALAVACPVCNKVVIALLGVSGALELWAPAQPAVGAAVVLLLGFAVALRWPTGDAGADDPEPGHNRDGFGLVAPVQHPEVHPAPVLQPGPAGRATATGSRLGN